MKLISLTFAHIQRTIFDSQDSFVSKLLLNALMISHMVLLIEALERIHLRIHGAWKVVKIYILYRFNKTQKLEDFRGKGGYKTLLILSFPFFFSTTVFCACIHKDFNSLLCSETTSFGRMLFWSDMTLNITFWQTEGEIWSRFLNVILQSL